MGIAAILMSLLISAGVALDQGLPGWTISGRAGGSLTFGSVVLIAGATWGFFVVLLAVQGALLSRLRRLVAANYGDAQFVGIVQTRWQDKIRFVHPGGSVSVLPFNGVLVLSSGGVRFVHLRASVGDVVLPWNTILAVTTESTKPRRIVLRLASPASPFPFTPLDDRWMLLTRAHRGVELIDKLSDLIRRGIDSGNEPSTPSALSLGQEDYHEFLGPPAPIRPPEGRHIPTTHRDVGHVHPGISAFRLRRWSLIAGASSFVSVVVAAILFSLGEARYPFIPLGVVLMVGPPIASYLLHFMANMASKREFELGYTTYRDRFIDLKQRHPVTGQVIREAGQPFLSESEWHALYPGRQTGESGAR